MFYFCWTPLYRVIKSLCAPDDYNTLGCLAQSDCLADDRQGQGDTRLTLTPSAMRNSNYICYHGKWFNLFKIILPFFFAVIIRCTETFWLPCIYIWLNMWILTSDLCKIRLSQDLPQINIAYSSGRDEGVRVLAVVDKRFERYLHVLFV
jgi:hypothetical protein